MQQLLGAVPLLMLLKGARQMTGSLCSWGLCLARFSGNLCAVLLPCYMPRANQRAQRQLVEAVPVLMRRLKGARQMIGSL